MTPAMIPAYIDNRMKEMGHCSGYAMRHRHYTVDPRETIRITAYGEVFVLLEEASDMRIESELGVYASGGNAAAEQQHEHSGQISITNLAADGACSVQFIQAIPMENTGDCHTCD